MRNLVLLVFSFSITLGVLTFAHAQTPDAIQQKITAQQEEIKKLDAEIAVYEKQLTQIGAQKQTLQNIISGLELSRKQLVTKINATKKQISTTELEIQQLDSDIGDASNSIDANYEALGNIMRSLQEFDTESLLESLLTRQTISELWNQTEAIEQFNGALRERVLSLQQARQSLTTSREKSGTKRAQLVRERQTLSSQEQSLVIAQREQNAILSQTKSQESNYQAILQQKQAEKSVFEATLFALASSLDYALYPSRIPAIGKGVLRWPLDKIFITQQFGKTSSSGRLYASGTHDGVDFRAAIGTPVKASLTGTVVEVNNGAIANCQYGKWIVIRHGNNLSTLYAHLSEVSVTKGSTIATGQVIGYSGNTGYSTGPHLHMTVYVTDALTFKNYNCKNGRSTTIPVANPGAYLNPLNYL